MHKGITKDLSSPAKSPQGKPPASAKEYLVMPESTTPGASRQAQNTHHALHTPAPNPHANPQDQQKHQDHNHPLTWIIMSVFAIAGVWTLLIMKTVTIGIGADRTHFSELLILSVS